MIICNKCGRSNEERYKFCLGCGAPLGKLNVGGVPSPEPAPQAGPLPVFSQAQQPPAHHSLASAPTAPAPSPANAPAARHPMPLVQQPQPVSLPHLSPAPPPRPAPQPAMQPIMQPVPQPVVMPQAAAIVPTTKTCGQCGATSPVDFLFCGRCGNRFDVAAAAPQPAAPQTAPITSITVSEVQDVRARLTLINPDGSAGGSMSLFDGETLLGRLPEHPILQEDLYVSPTHARVTCDQGRVLIEDLDSANGTFLQLGPEPLVLEQEDILRIGQQLLRFETLESQVPGVRPYVADGTRVLGGPPPAAWGLLRRIVAEERGESDVFMLTGPEQLVGRERGNIVFRQDGFVSGQHARFAPSDSGATLQDLRSSNGTYLRLRGPYEACDGDLFLIGQRVFQLHVHM